MSAVFAPYIRVCIAERLEKASVFCLQMAYFEYRLAHPVVEDLQVHEQFYWLPEESAESLMDGLSRFQFDSLVEHLTRTGNIPEYAIASVTESLHRQLNDYCSSIICDLISDFEVATGQSASSLQTPLRQSDAAKETDEGLSINLSVRNLLRFVERANNEIAELVHLMTNTGIASTGASATKQRCRTFRVEVERRFSSFEGRVPEMADSWLLKVLALFENHPQYFGR